MRKMPVKGACITPLISPHMPNMAKFLSGMSMPSTSYMFQSLQKMKPQMQPRNRLGAKIPPQPPPPLVAVEANTLKTTIRKR